MKLVNKESTTNLCNFRLCRESGLLESCDKVDLMKAVRSELCSTGRQSKNYRHRLLLGKPSWNKLAEILYQRKDYCDAKNY